jgi:Tol biopolymer transport system component
MFHLVCALLVATSLHGEMVSDRPEIAIGFDDDASSLIITADFKDKGVVKRETFSLGKDMHLVFGQEGKEFKKLDEEFRSKSWEAFLLPDASGFFLMEREYDGHSFENVSLTIYDYYPERRVRSLRLANGSPYWSPDGKQLALVEPDNGRYNVVLYDVEKGSVTYKKSALTEEATKASIADFVRARVCDDEIPCESTPVGKIKKPVKMKK